MHSLLHLAMSTYDQIQNQDALYVNVRCEEDFMMVGKSSKPMWLQYAPKKQNCQENSKCEGMELNNICMNWKEI